MNLFSHLGDWVPGRKESETPDEDSPFAYLAERSEHDGAIPSQSNSAELRYEREFQGRVATAAELNSWLMPLLEDLRDAAYPNHEVHGFIHWINHTSDCPWLILSENLEYTARHQDTRADLIYWDTHPQPRIRWTIGSHSDHPYARSQAWAYNCQVEIELHFTDGEPDRFRVRRFGPEPMAKECKVSLIDITKRLVQLHP
jgi:hypothetical protein